MTPDGRTAGVTTTPTVQNREATKPADVRILLGRADSTPDVDSLVRGALVVVVRVSEDRYRRRTFMTLKAAQRAADNARGRGQAAEVVLCELLPVGRCP